AAEYPRGCVEADAIHVKDGKLFTSAGVTAGMDRSGVREIQDHVLANLKDDPSVPVPASRAGMSERTFARIFRSETGTTPAEFVEKARIDAARRLAEESELPAKPNDGRGAPFKPRRRPVTFLRARRAPGQTIPPRPARSTPRWSASTRAEPSTDPDTTRFPD